MNSWVYIISGAIWIGFILHWTVSSIPKRRIFEMYAGGGIAICLTLVMFGLFGWYTEAVYQSIQVVGNILLFSAIAVALISIMTLKLKGKPEKGFEETQVLIEGTIFGIIRHPLYVALMIWGLSQIFAIQSMISMIGGLVAIGLFWMSAKKEDAFNIKKFGERYKEYMQNVPRVNFILGGIRRFRRRTSDQTGK